MPISTAVAIGIDLGTSGVRACAIDSAETLLETASTTLPSPAFHGDSGGDSITQDAHLWWQATQTVLSKLLCKLNGRQVSAIAVNGTSGTLLACDTRGQPLAPARMYNDRQCQDEAVRIARVAPAQSAAHGASSGLAKLLYLQQQVPGIPRFLHQADWIAGQLCGRFDFSDANNALKTGYDPVQQQWPDWLAQLGVDFKTLPRVYLPGQFISPIRAELATRLQISPQCRIVSGTTDSLAAFIASGASRPGQAVTSLGSTLVLKVISETPVFAPKYGIYSHKLGDYWLAGGASNSGGAVLAHYFSNSQLQQLSQSLQNQAQQGELAPSRLDYYPLLQAGERFPVNNPNYPPRLSPRPDTDEQFLQGLLEGISRIERLGYEKLQQLGAPYPSEVFSAGGGSHNPLWTKMRQASLGVPLKQAQYSEACYGSALLALRAE